MKHKNTTIILQSMAILAKIENGYTEFREMLSTLDKTDKREYMRFWQYIVNCGDKFKESESDKRYAYKAAFGATAKFSMRKANAMLRQLSEWIDEYAMGKKTAQRGSLVQAKYFHDKGEKEKSDAALKATLEKSVKSDEITKVYTQTQVYHDQYFFDENRSDKPELLALLQKTKYTAQAFAHTIIFKASLEELTYIRARGEDIPEEIRSFLKRQFALLPEKPTTLVSLQVLAIKLFLSPSLEAYNAFKFALFENTGNLNSERNSLLVYLVNTLIVFPFFRGKTMEEHLSIYEFAINSNTFIINGEISMRRFNNMVLVFKSLGKYQLLEQFIKTHGELIRNKEERINSVLFSECHILFGKGKYFTAIQELKKVKSIDHTFTLGKLILKAKCVYEHEKNNIDSYAEIADMKESFERLVNRYYNEGKFDIKAKKRYNNFFKLIAYITNNKKSKDKLIKLYKSFGGKSAEIKWLEEKIAELE